MIVECEYDSRSVLCLASPCARWVVLFLGVLVLKIQTHARQHQEVRTASVCYGFTQSFLEMQKQRGFVYELGRRHYLFIDKTARKALDDHNGLHD